MALFGTVFAVEPVIAQTGPEEIVVTARKREESLQEVPLSLTAFSAEQLQKTGATNNYDVALLTPNFNTMAQLGRRLDRPVIRGMAAPAVGGEPNASYFIDGAFVSGSISSATIGPVERVEILRGPQSAQFGRATFSGAVNYVTRQPTDEFESEVRVVGGSNDTIQVSGWGSGPIIEDKLAFFAAAGYDKFGGEWHNNLKENQASDVTFFTNPPQMADSSRLGETESKEITGKLRWTPGDTSTVTLKLGYNKADDGHYAQYILEPGELNCYLPTDANQGESWYATSQGAYCGAFDIDRVSYVADNPFSDPANRIAGGPNNGDPRQSRFNLPDFREGITSDLTPEEDWNTPPREPGNKREQVRSLLQYEQDFGEWTATTRLTYNNDELDSAYDLDHTEKRPLAGVFHFWEKLDVEDKAFEFLVDSPAEGRLRGSIGVYWFDSQRNSRTHSTPGYTLDFTGLAQYSDPLVTDIRNKSIFGSLEYDITDRLMLGLEARYANDVKTMSTSFRCTDPTSPYFNELAGDETDEDAFTPRFTVNYQATDDIMLYALAAKGNKPAEFNTGYFRATADPCATLAARDNPEEDGGSLTHTKEEKAWTYEVGTKTAWLNGRIIANLSAYYIDWTNQATFQTVQIGSVIANVQRNAGKSEVYGVEVESSYALTDNWSASLSYGLANGKYEEYNDPFFANTTGIGLDADGNIDNAANNVGGNYIPNNPKHSIIAALSYAKDISADMNWFARTDYVLESKRYVDAANFMFIPNRDVWNGRVGLEAYNWTVTAYVNNILDQQTPTSIPNFLYFPDTGVAWDKEDCNTQRCWVESWAAGPSRGRNWGLDLIFRFGS